MPFIPIPGCAQVNIRGTINGVPMENVLHFRKESATAWSSAQLGDLNSAVITNWAVDIVPLFASGYVALSVYCRDLTFEAGAVFEGNFPPGTAGQADGETLPGNVALVLTHTTGLAGRSFRGRTYFGGLSELSVAANNAVSGFVSNLGEGFSNFIGTLAGNDFLLVVASKYSNNAPRSPGIMTTVQNSSFRDTRVDSQRRRLS